MGLLRLGLKLKNVLKTKKVSPTIPSVKEKFNVGSADKIKKKGKEFKEKIAGDERKEAMTRYFTNQPPKKTKKTKKTKSKVKHYTAPKDFTW